VDVRIIAATNQHLEAMIEQGKFRLDLYYRLRGVTIQLPRLCERREDIPELAHYFLFRINRELGTNVVSIAEETLERLLEYAWPGNVRELQSVIREALLRSAGPTLLPEFLPETVTSRGSLDVPLPRQPSGQVATWQSLADEVTAAISQENPGVYRRALAKFDQILVAAALEKTSGNQAAAAELLGLSRPTLRGKLRALRGMEDALDGKP